MPVWYIIEFTLLPSVIIIDPNLTDIIANKMHRYEIDGYRLGTLTSYCRLIIMIQ